MAHLKISNNSEKTVPIIPATFVLDVSKPKPHTPRFEYQSRVSYQIATIPARVTLDGESVRDILERSAEVVLQSMATGSLLLAEVY